MGLAASQARLLTITSRKSDCEFQSMRYSHEKIALSRSMTDLSTQYQNSLDATKLVYDFYGTGDTSYGLTYGLMMTPSELNGYLPILTTDTSGKTVLNSAYAAAARAAGIPQEGIGSLPSQEVRNNFLDGLAANGILTTDQAETYKGIQYASSMGLGTTDLVTTQVESMTISELLNAYTSGAVGNVSRYNCNINSIVSTLQGSTGNAESGNPIVNTGELRVGDGLESINSQDLTLQNILSGNVRLLFRINYGDESGNGSKGDMDTRTAQMELVANSIQALDIWDWMFEEFESMLGVTGDNAVTAAMAYAKSQVSNLLSGDNPAIQYQKTYTEDPADHRGYSGAINCIDQFKYSNPHPAGNFFGTLLAEQSINNADYIGIVEMLNMKDYKSNRADSIGINVTNIAEAYLTYFAQAMEGLSFSEYHVSSSNGNRLVADSNLLDINDNDFLFSVQTATGINTDQALQSGFYDAIFNQICLNGWTENNNVNDSDYLQEMIKTGKYMISTCSDDGYYYQGSYSTNTYIREISDDEAIAKAEAKYNTEKQRLNQKEEIIDLKMKNLDTEISSLTTEYDTVKSLISKNIEKGFKRYDA